MASSLLRSFPSVVEQAMIKGYKSPLVPLQHLGPLAAALKGRNIEPINVASAKVFGNCIPNEKNQGSTRQAFGYLRNTPNKSAIVREKYLHHPNFWMLKLIPGYRTEQSMFDERKMRFKKSKGFVPVQKGAGKRAKKGGKKK